MCTLCATRATTIRLFHEFKQSVRKPLFIIHDQAASVSFKTQYHLVECNYSLHIMISYVTPFTHILSYVTMH